jgi:hypothetical protein
METAHEKPVSVTMTVEKMLRLVRALRMVCGNDDSRPSIYQVGVERDREGAVCVATDGRIMLAYSVGLGVQTRDEWAGSGAVVNGNGACTVPAEALPVFEKALRAMPAKARKKEQATLSENVLICAGQQIHSVRPLASVVAFPPWRRVMPAGPFDGQPAAFAAGTLGTMLSAAEILCSPGAVIHTSGPTDHAMLLADDPGFRGVVMPINIGADSHAFTGTYKKDACEP